MGKCFLKKGIEFPMPDPKSKILAGAASRSPEASPATITTKDCAAKDGNASE